MIGHVIGSYRIERELSEGGMSHVYVGRTTCATDALPANFPVVLKVMSDELAGELTARKRFVKEAQILAKLRHRYITRFYEFIPRDSGAVLVMEFVEGSPLDQLITEKGALRITDAIQYVQCLLDALVYAHGKEIVHRDIKPANLIQQNGGGVKVTDFGIAKIRDAASSGQTVLTKSGFLLGTPHYMSPEQIRDPKEAGARSDIYSTGVVLYEMLTGVLPFNQRSLPKLIEAVYRGEKQRPSELRPEIDRELETILLRAMEPKQEQRFTTAREFYESLEEYVTRRPEAGERLRSHDITPRTANSVAPGWQLVRQDAGEQHEVRGESVMVGRDRSCSIVLSHPAVSRRHARFTVGSEFLLEDLQSANGTYVNNSRIARAVLKAGDVVRFGADPACTYVIRARQESAR